MKFPYLMSKETMLYCPYDENAVRQYGDKLVPITAEQAADIDNRGKEAGVEVLRRLVAKDNEEYLRRAEAQLDAMAAPPKSADLTAAEPEKSTAEEAEPERPWEAKPIKGNPPKKDLIAFLLDKGVEDAESLSYDDLKTTAASMNWVAEHGEK